ncbi:MAG: transposase, partial [Firmicutes bacterium]|nr:transposase [Bacillota bacterium]
HNTTTPKMTRVKESFTLKNATIFGGANILADYAEVVGLERLFARHLGFEKAPNADYPMDKSMTAFVLATALGHERIFHLAGVEDDPLLGIKMGWDKLPDYTTYYHDIHRFDTLEKVDLLRPVLAAVAGRTMRASCILDFDSTVETAYGSQEGAAVGYNKDKPGRPSLHPLLVFDGLSQALLNGRLREGTTGSATGFKAFLHQTLALYPGVTVDYIRRTPLRRGRGLRRGGGARQEGLRGQDRQFPALMEKAALFPWRRVEYTDVILEVQELHASGQGLEQAEESSDGTLSAGGGGLGEPGEALRQPRVANHGHDHQLGLGRGGRLAFLQPTLRRGELHQ